MDGSFDKLVREMDDAGRQGLREALAKESAERRQEAAFRLEDINPNMSEQDRARAQEHIMRVLRGEE